MQKRALPFPRKSRRKSISSTTCWGTCYRRAWLSHLVLSGWASGQLWWLSLTHSCFYSHLTQSCFLQKRSSLSSRKSTILAYNRLNSYSRNARVGCACPLPGNVDCALSLLPGPSPQGSPPGSGACAGANRAPLLALSHINCFVSLIELEIPESRSITKLFLFFVSFFLKTNYHLWLVDDTQ